MIMIWVVRSRISTIVSIFALVSFSALGVGRGGSQSQGVHSAFSQGGRRGSCQGGAWLAGWVVGVHRLGSGQLTLSGPAGSCGRFP